MWAVAVAVTWMLVLSPVTSTEENEVEGDVVPEDATTSDPPVSVTKSFTKLTPGVPFRLNRSQFTLNTPQSSFRYYDGRPQMPQGPSYPKAPQPQSPYPPYSQQPQPQHSGPPPILNSPFQATSPQYPPGQQNPYAYHPQPQVSPSQYPSMPQQPTPHFNQIPQGQGQHKPSFPQPPMNPIPGSVGGTYPPPQAQGPGGAPMAFPIVPTGSQGIKGVPTFQTPGGRPVGPINPSELPPGYQFIPLSALMGGGNFPQSKDANKKGKKKIT